MDQYRKDVMFSLFREFKAEKRRKNQVYFKSQCRVLCVLVVVLAVMLVVGLFVR